MTNQNPVTKLFCGLAPCKRVFGLLVLMFGWQCLNVYVRDNVINKTCSSINVEGHNLVKCFCVNPTCDWLTDSSNNLPKYFKNLTVSFFGSIGNDLCLGNHHLEFCSVTSDS